LPFLGRWRWGETNTIRSPGVWGVQLGLLIDTLWLFNIAMENGPFIDGLPRKNGDFPWLC